MVQILTLSTVLFNCIVFNDVAQKLEWRQTLPGLSPQIPEIENISLGRFLGNKNRRKIVIFLHIHKCAGSFFIGLVRKLPNQIVPSNDGLITCPFLRSRSSHLKKLCGTSQNAVLPFWNWPSQVQARYFSALNYTFIANERWLGHTVKDHDNHSPDSLHVEYVTIIRNPLDRIASHFHYARMYPASALHGRNLSLASFIRDGPCREPDAGFRCWDTNHYIQVGAIMSLEATKP